jgi:SAM-dependent methyltransferase
MTPPPLLTDRPALLRNRARALRDGPALFLHQDAAAEIEERLNEVNRTFTAPAVVTTFAEPWAEILPQAKIVSDDDVLALEPEAHDLVIHALSLQWANDPVGQLVQCRRSLRPDGMLIAVMFGGQTLAELRAVLAEVEVQLTGGLSPRILPMGEIRDLGALLQRAGFALPVADSLTRPVSYRDMAHLMADLRAMGEANALAARRRNCSRRALFLQAAKHYAQSFPADDGRITASFEMIFLTGWAPHESQKKPLRPGSATHSLAQALAAPTPHKD